MNASRRRKIIYLVLLAVCFSTILGVNRWIDRSAQKYHLDQRSLGEVDPVSSSAQLVSLGFRGVAVTLLWQEAIDLKRRERWYEILPVVRSITLLQPNFLEPWIFQGWNLAFNVAAEWEAVRDKYFWIRQGVDFMKDAVRANQGHADLEWNTGWLYLNRFSLTDDRMYLRELFKKDTDDDYTMSKSGVRDPFEVSYDWFDQANDTVRKQNKPPKRMGIIPFMTYPAISKSKYAEYQQKDGVFGHENEQAWRAAHEEWLRYGLEGGPDSTRDLKLRLDWTPEQLAKLPPHQRELIERYWGVTNYPYWKARTLAESEKELQTARKAFYAAQVAEKKGDYSTAIAEYEKAFPIWRSVLEKSEPLRDDIIFYQESQNYEDRYLQLLHRLDRPLPEKRPFDGLYDPLFAPPS